jgi:hypothetical protein
MLAPENRMTGETGMKVNFYLLGSAPGAGASRIT